MKTSTYLMSLMVFVAVLAGNDSGAMVYHVTIEDLDLLQPLSPPVAVIHDSGYSIFETGQVSTPGLEGVAEEGNPTILVEEASANPSVHRVFVGGQGPTFDGFKFYIVGEPGDRFSLVAMLGRTNDNFIGLSSMTLPAEGDPMVIQTEAYDAGTEVNTGMAADLGFYGNPGVGETENGVVQIIHQYTIVDDPDVGMLEFNWPPSAMITITPVPDAIAYQVTMTNETAGQGLSPSAVILHDETVQVFMEGETASAGIEGLAESGSSKTLSSEMTLMDGVYQATFIGSGPGNEQMGTVYGIPGEKATILSMFGRTNDIFTGVMDLTLPQPGETISMNTSTWDAGTEINTGLVADVPFYGGQGSPAENGVITMIQDYAIMDDPDEGMVEFHWPPSAMLKITGMAVQSDVNHWNLYE